MLLECDAALNPSDSESGMPFALIETLLAGTPVVATDAGGVVDLLADPRDGRLVPKGDAAALYEALCATLGESPKRKERASRAECRFGLEQMGHAHFALIEQSIGLNV
jgi:glycosyltransferase involved in cell wall biosynthesis